MYTGHWIHSLRCCKFTELTLINYPIIFNMKLSIIIPVYNVERYIKTCLESIYVQGLSENDFEVIIINDGSKDNSLEFVNEIASEHTNIIVKSKDNEGQGIARNLGISIAKGEYIYFLDADDQLIPNSLNKLLSVATDTKADITLSTMKVYDCKGNIKIHSDYTYYGEAVTGEYAILHGLNHGSACARLFSAAFINSHKLQFRGDIQHEDVLFSIYASVYAKKILSTDICTYMYTWNPISTDRKAGRRITKKSVVSDLEIAREERYIANNYTNNVELKEFLIKKSNSLVISNILKLLQQDRQLLREYTHLAKKYQLVPTKGKTLSWRTTLFSFILNTFFRFV